MFGYTLIPDGVLRGWRDAAANLDRAVREAQAEAQSLRYRLDLLNEVNEFAGEIVDVKAIAQEAVSQCEYNRKMLTLHSADVDTVRSTLASQAEAIGLFGGETSQHGCQIDRLAESLDKLRAKVSQLSKRKAVAKRVKK